ncbi:MAG: AmmeMemoRadiSam system radical SAM enzyme [Thermoplasmata archaeon]
MDLKELKDALFYEQIGEKDEKKVKCKLCPHNCRIADGRLGICRERANFDGKLKTLSWNKVVSMNVEPIEKKPLYHFYPGSRAYSIGTLGCNLGCSFCQNWEISQLSETGITDAQKMANYFNEVCLDISSEKIVENALNEKCVSIAYTYTEPLVWYEYVFETAKIARKKGIKNVLVTNGYIEEEPLRELLPYIDAMNIDLKAFDNEFYKKICKGKLEPVLRTIEITNKSKAWIEITNLIVPTLNDSEEMIKNLVSFISSLDKNIPLHFTRYYPAYNLWLEPTNENTLRKAKEIAEDKLNYVYIGNIPFERVDTRCPNCGNIAIKRIDFSVISCELDGNRCKSCGLELPIIGECKPHSE